MLKRVFCFLICLVMVLGFAACGKDDGDKVKTASMKGGTPTAPGDVFTMPEIKKADGTPTITGVNVQANPDDSVIVMGEGLDAQGAKAYVYAQTTKDNGKANEAKFTVSDSQTVMLNIDKSLEYGLYGIYFETDKGKSNVFYVNRPKIWWIGFTELSAGDEVKVYGENLTTDNGDKSHIYLVSSDGKHCELNVTYADPYKVTAKVPKGLTDGESYEVWVHNGHGGELGFAVAKEKITYFEDALVKYGDKIDVTKYGANPADDKKDDSAAIQKAVDEANEGDIIYIPAGKYLIENTVIFEKSLKFVGDGSKETILIMGTNTEDSMFRFKLGPVEFTKLGFKDVRNGKFKASFIHLYGEAVMTSNYNLYVHDCKFVQHTGYTQRAGQSAISVEHTSQVVVEDNIFEVTTMFFTNFVNKVYLTNNTHISTYYTGKYYDQNATLFWSTDQIDASDNQFYGKGLDSDKASYLSAKSYTAGRAYALQGHSNDVYMANNKMTSTGLPDDNAGEQIMFENGSISYCGPVENATATEFTLPDSIGLQVKNIDTIIIASGKGKGQYRAAKTMKGRTIILDEPFLVAPDSTSQILIAHGAAKNYAIHNNYMDGYTNYAENWGATCGVQAYSTNLNVFITKNTFKNMCYGLCISPHVADGLTNGLYWLIIQDNIIDEVSTGIRVKVVAQNQEKWDMNFGMAIRRNEFGTMKKFATPREGYPGGEGITLGSNESAITNRYINKVLIENNQFKNCTTTDIHFYKNQAGTVLRNNTGKNGEKINTTIEYLASEPTYFK